MEYHVGCQGGAVGIVRPFSSSGAPMQVFHDFKAGAGTSRPLGRVLPCSRLSASASFIHIAVQKVHEFQS